MLSSFLRVAAGAALACAPAAVHARQCLGWMLRDSGSGPSARATVAPLAHDPARRVTYLFGGQDFVAGRYVFFNDLWAWDGSAWADLSPTAGPRPIERSSGGVAFDTARDRLVIVGGYRRDAARSNDTWEFNPASRTWANVWSSGPGPTVCYEPMLVYDQARALCLLFGGSTPTGASNQFWAWNGSQWSQPPAGPRPTPRFRAVMVYDSVRNVTVLYGGAGPTGAPLADTWEWDGSAWAQRAASGPPPAAYAAAAFDTHRGVTVLHIGGQTPSGPGGDVWEWNGTVWTRRQLTGPPNRYAHGAGYDPVARQTLVFGGLIIPTGSSPSVHRDLWAFSDAGFSAAPVPDQAICLRGQARFTAVPHTTQTPSFLWRRDGTPLIDGPTGTGSTIAGARGAQLTITDAGFFDQGQYDCLMTGDCGDSATAPAALTICGGDWSCDGAVDFNDLLAFLNDYNAAEPRADLTDDGVVDFNDLLAFLNLFNTPC